MVSQDARSGLNRIFARAAQASLAVNSGDTISVEARPDGAVSAAPDEPIVVLTVASYRFRLLTLFHLRRDPALADYYTRGDGARELADVFSEFGNLCCGAMNRELGGFFGHTGMSTPYRLEGGCLAFLEDLGAAWIAPQRITINGVLSFDVTLCLCAYAPIDFCVDPDAAPETTGELELF